MPIEVWLGFISFMVLMIAADLVVLHRRPRRPSGLESLGRTFVWLTVAGGFNAAIWFAFHHDWMGVATAAGLRADEASLRFLTGFLTELALDLDTVFVVAAIFAHRRTPEHLQHQVLFFGVLLALVTRLVYTSIVGEVLSAWPWMRFAFSTLLVLAALRMLLVRQENADPARNIFVRVTRYLVPVADPPSGDVDATSRPDGQPELTVRLNGKLALSSLFVTIVLIETADAFFAADSIPAVFTVTQSPFLVFASNCFALLVLRSLFFALQELSNWIRYLKVPLAALLGLAAVKMALPTDVRVPTYVSLTAVASALAIGFGAAIVFARSGPTPAVSPLGEEAERLARLTLKQARKLVVLVVGSTVVGIGVLMLIGPGPGLLVIPIGLALLASEFVWAKRLLDQYTDRASRLGLKAGNAVAKRTPLWVIPVVIVATIAAIVVAIVHFNISPKLVLPGALPMFIGQGFWAYLTFKQHRQAKRDRCTACGYVTQGLPADQCPECGTTMPVRAPVTDTDTAASSPRQSDEAA